MPGEVPAEFMSSIPLVGARFEDRTTIDFTRGLSKLVGGFVAPPRYEN